MAVDIALRSIYKYSLTDDTVLKSSYSGDKIIISGRFTGLIADSLIAHLYVDNSVLMETPWSWLNPPSGVSLDNLAIIFGYIRGMGESDKSFRSRIKSMLAGQAPRTVGPPGFNVVP